jgi:hypothetical protein
MTHEYKALPKEISSEFKKSKIQIDEEDDSEFFIGFKPNKNSTDLDFIREILKLDFDVNFDGQVIISQDLKTISFQYYVDNSIDKEIEIEAKREQTIEILQRLVRLRYPLYNVFGKNISYKA